MSRRERAARPLISAAAAFFVLALPVAVHAQAQPTTPGIGTPTPQSGPPLGPAGRTPVGPGQAESIADPLGGFDDEGTVPLGEVLEGIQAETGFPETDRAARGVEANQPGDIEQPLEDVELQARGVRLQGEQVNEELLDLRAETARGVEPSEGPRAGPSEVPLQNVPGGGVNIIPGTGVLAPGAGQRRAGAGGQLAAQAGDVGELQAGAGAPPAGQGVTAAGTGIDPAMPGALEEAEEYSRVTVTGRVAQVSYGDSMAQVVTDDHGVVTVRARPQEIALLQPGDFVALEVQRVGQSLWLSPAERFEPASADVTAALGTGALSRDVSSPIFEDQGEIAGVITAINPDGGLVQVGERRFQAHPAQLKGLEAGQLISVSYGTVAGEDWAADIRVGAGAAEIEREVERPGGGTQE